MHNSRTLALDRASIRRTDQDGHLHVALTPISKAAVNPYLGREIPGYEALGLDPDRTYNLLRDPDELAKAAPTFAGKPLLLDHEPVSADDHPRGRTVGAVGEGVVWRAPYLMAPLSVWDGEAIRGIESGRQKELSSAYRYTPVLEPGTYQGQHYDLRMTGIIGNHVSLVAEGRAGSDVVVGDSRMKRNKFNFSRFAFDEAEPAPAAAPSVLPTLKALAKKLDANQWAELRETLLGGNVAGDEADRDPEVIDYLLNGPKAMDAARAEDFAARFPDAARVGCDDRMGTRQNPQSRNERREQSRDFDERFPDLARIKHV